MDLKPDQIRKMLQHLGESKASRVIFPCLDPVFGMGQMTYTAEDFPCLDPVFGMGQMTYTAEDLLRLLPLETELVN